MQILNRKIEYALMILKYIGEKPAGKITSVKEISATLMCPFDTIAHVMQLLSQKKILKSEQGAYGGYLLIENLDRISLYDLMEILSPFSLVKCVHSSCFLEENCSIQEPLLALQLKLANFYKSLSLREVLKFKKKKDQKQKNHKKNQNRKSQKEAQKEAFKKFSKKLKVKTLKLSLSGGG